MRVPRALCGAVSPSRRTGIATSPNKWQLGIRTGVIYAVMLAEVCRKPQFSAILFVKYRSREELKYQLKHRAQDSTISIVKELQQTVANPVQLGRDGIRIKR
jgi:hypothetical protein